MGVLIFKTPTCKRNPFQDTPFSRRHPISRHPPFSRHPFFEPPVVGFAYGNISEKKVSGLFLTYRRGRSHNFNPYVLACGPKPMGQACIIIFIIFLCLQGGIIISIIIF